MNAQAPRVATWLADRFLTSRTRESLIGDLMEQYREGRSASWYRGQVLRAIGASTVEELAAHKHLALRALGIGLALYFLFSVPVASVSVAAAGWLGNAGVSCEPAAFWCQFLSNQFSAELLVYFACAVGGLSGARSQRTAAARD